MYTWSILLGSGFLVGFIFLMNEEYVGILFFLLAMPFLFVFYYMMGHVRTAFQMK
jgi:hypothetical protein